MSPNIHTFDETRNANNNNNTNRRGLLGDSNTMNDMFSFPGMSSKETKDPRHESFFYMVYINFCPMLSFCSFTVIISIVLTAIFVLQMIVDGLVIGQAQQFLEVNKDGTMSSNLAISYTDFRGSLNNQ